MTWALLDARAPDGEVPAWATLAGMPQVARQVRMAARQGWTGVRVIAADAAARTAIERALAWRPPPPGFRVEILVADDSSNDSARSVADPREARSAPAASEIHAHASRAPAAPARALAAGGTPAPADPTPAEPVVPLDPRALYTHDELSAAVAAGRAPTPYATIRTPLDLRAAERLLFRALRKSLWQDGFVAYLFMRRLSVPLSRLLVGTRVTPNQVTVVAMLCGLVAAALAALGGYGPRVAAGLLFVLGSTIDCIDGELARLRVEGSRAGEWLDSLADDVSTFGLLAGLGYGLYRSGSDPLWLWMGLGGAAVGFATQAKLYFDLDRMGAPIDTAQYPWFFGKPSTGEAAQKGILGRAFAAVALLFRRDAFVTIVAALLVLDAPRVATVLIASGGLLVTALLAVHYAVLASRR